MTVTAGAGEDDVDGNPRCQRDNGCCPRRGIDSRLGRPRTSGELSWNATTKTLTVSGTIFIDGSAKVSNGRQHTTARRRSTSRDVLFNGSLCGVASGASCNFANWNPNTEMLMFVANGTGGQVSPRATASSSRTTLFPGRVFATGDAEFGNNVELGRADHGQPDHALRTT